MYKTEVEVDFTTIPTSLCCIPALSYEQIEKRNLNSSQIGIFVIISTEILRMLSVWAIIEGWKNRTESYCI